VGVKHERGSYGQEPIDSVGVSLTVPLGGGAEMAPKRAEAAEKLAEAERQQELEIRRQKIALHEAEHELEVCLVQQEIAGEHYAMANENLRLARRAFELGESDLMDLLRVQEQYFQSANAHTRWGLECSLKTARYNQTKGILPE
jgi:outer membrane protein TolC